MHTRPSTSTTTIDALPLAPWVTATRETCRGGRTLFTAVNHRTHRAIELNEDDLDPDHGVPDALVDELRCAGFLTDSPAGSTAPERRSILAGARHVLATLDVAWRRADVLVGWLHRHGLRHCFHPAAVVAQVLLALAGVAATHDVITSAPTIHLHVRAAAVPVAIGIGLAAVAVHELAHAVVVKHHGRSIESIGFRLHLGSPSFYVESVEALILTRRQRLVQAAAGPWAEWLFTSVVALGVWALAPGGLAALLLTRFVALNIFTIVSNLLPFGGLDGSHLLADLVRVPDLSRRSRGAAGRLVAARARGGVARREDVLLAGYAVANVAVSTGLFVLSMVLWYELFGGLVASTWASGPAGAALVVVAGVVLGRPAVLAVLPDVVEVTGTVRRGLHDLRFRRSVDWRRAAMRELHRSVPAIAQLDERALGIAAGLLTAVRGPAVDPTAGLLVVSVPPMRGARRGITAALDMDLVRGWTA